MKKICLLLIIFITTLYSACNTEAADKKEITKQVSAIGNAVDKRDWEALRKIFKNPFNLDYSSFGGGKAGLKKIDDVIKAWKFLEGFDSTFHDIPDYKVTIIGNTAHVFSKVKATHKIKGHKPWIVYGSYNHKLVKENGKWKVSGMKFNFKKQEGNKYLPKVAQKKLKKN